MPIYTVHAPVGNGADLAATDKFTFVRDGFHFWAAALTIIWLVWHRLWLALIGWVVVTVAIDPRAAGEVPSTKGQLGG